MTRQSYSVCIVQPTVGAISETFITAHAERLPADVTVIRQWSRSIPEINNRPLLSHSVVRRGYRRLVSRQQRGGELDITAGFVKAFTRTNADAVLAEYGQTGVRVLDACRKTRLPLVVHFHGVDASRHDILRDYKEGYRILFAEAAAIIAVSRAMQKRLIDLGAPAEKVHYNPYGVDCEKFRCADPAANPPTFLSVGRFVEKKAPYLTLLAFKDLLEHCPDARLRMIGSGQLLGVCQDLAKGFEIENSVDFLGAKSHDVVAAEMQKARAFVQHSVEATDGNCEGTPNSVLEAGASGLPVIATRHAGIPDVVLEGITGFLVDERDVKAMAGHMIQLAQDASLAARLGSAARTRVQDHFTMERSIGNLWKVIDSCIVPSSRRLAMQR